MPTTHRRWKLQYIHRGIAKYVKYAMRYKILCAVKLLVIWSIASSSFSSSHCIALISINLFNLSHNLQLHSLNIGYALRCDALKATVSTLAGSINQFMHEKPHKMQAPSFSLCLLDELNIITNNNSIESTADAMKPILTTVLCRRTIGLRRIATVGVFKECTHNESLINWLLRIHYI